MTGRVGARGSIRRLVSTVLLLGLVLSSVEVLWAEGAEPISPETATATLGGAQGPAPVSPDEGGDDCPCMCACACTNVQVVVLPEPAAEQVAALVAVRAPVLPWPGPSYLLPEPLLPPPRVA